MHIQTDYKPSCPIYRGWETLAMKFLEEDIRFDMEKLHTQDKGILTTYAKTGKNLMKFKE